MAFWSTQRVELEQTKLNLISPFNPDRVEQGHYELSLSREVLTTEDENGYRASQGEGKTLEIRPGQFALLYTSESVSIPTDAIAFISIKATIKLKGLINVSGFHIDPGFKGKIKFSVYNAANKSIFVQYDDPLFLIWFADLDQATNDPYKGNHKGQKGISATDREQLSGKGHSPSALNQRLESLEKRFLVGALLSGIFITAVVLPLVIALVTPVVQRYMENRIDRRNLQEKIEAVQKDVNILNNRISKEGGKSSSEKIIQNR